MDNKDFEGKTKTIKFFNFDFIQSSCAVRQILNKVRISCFLWSKELPQKYLVKTGKASTCTHRVERPRERMPIYGLYLC